MKKLKALTMLLLVSTLFGWTQSSQNWIISKNSKDTLIIYSFTKQQFVNLRLYVTKGEQYKELYTIEKEQSKKKDDLILVQKEQLENRNFTINLKDAIINQIKLDNSDLNIKLKVEADLKEKYKKKAKALPYWFSAGAIGGFIGCWMLIK